MSGKPHRPVLSSRINPETGERDIYELMPEEAEAAIKRLIESLPPSKPITPEDIETAAKRGADNARKLLAGNPTREDIQMQWQMSIDDEEVMGQAMTTACERAFRRVLRSKLS